MSSFPLLVTLHNLVNIPVSMAQSHRTFTVEAQLRDAVTTSYSAPPASASFTSADIVESAPHLREVQLDKVSRPGSLNSAKVWRCTASLLEVVVTVRETAVPEETTWRERVIATSAPLVVNPREVVEWEKLATRIVGTEVGQVGLSFRVDPADKVGYRTRLEKFLHKYNPQGLRLIDSVVEAVPETDTFAKLYKKYKLADYTKRLTSFFSVYGPAFVSQIPSLLGQWENKEMELMNHLILDNGPEMKDVEPSERLAAFFSAYDLQADDPRVQELRTRTGCKTPLDLLDVLAQTYGPEPDPRTYLFPPTRYSSATESSPMLAGPPGNPSAHQRRVENSSPRTPVRPAADAHLTTPPSEGRYLSLAVHSPLPTRPGAPTGHLRDGGDSEDDVRLPEKRSATAPGVAVGDAQRRPQSSDIRRDGEDETESGADAWRKLCEHLRLRGNRGADNSTGIHGAAQPLREADLFYGTAEDFERRLDGIGAGLTRRQKDVLTVEWERRARQALQIEPLLQDDPYFGSAAKEAVRLTGLQPLHLQVMTVTAVFHREHHAAFAARLDTAKERTAERLVLVGDATTLERIARYGLKPLPSVGDSASRPPAAVFQQRPFQHWSSRHTTGILICDVVVGRAFVNPASVTIPAEGTSAFLTRYDSCVFVDRANGPAVAVYEPQQVLPRLLLHCTVDPTLVACSAHPDRPVEYYVADCDAFACSRCVVLGEFKGCDVTTIAEAAVLARARLAEVHRTSLALRDSMDAFEKQLEQETALMANAPRRVNAEKEVARLRREVEERIRSILSEVELADKEQLERIQLDRDELKATRDGALQLCETIDKATRESVNPLQVVSALQKVQQDRMLEQLLDRAEHRLPEAPLEKVAPLAGLPLPPPPSQTSGAAPPSYTTSAIAQRATRSDGLNESRFSGAGNRPAAESGAARAASGAPSRPAPLTAGRPTPFTSTQQQHVDKDGGTGENRALSSAYGGPRTKNTQTAPPPAAGKPPTSQPVSQGEGTATSVAEAASAWSAATPATAAAKEEAEKAARRALTQGWALLRQGDADGARVAWDSVSREFDCYTTSLGAKARAYTAEALDKDYAAASHWYAQAVAVDPSDRMTAYNYGVLLEALLDEPRKALELYDSAAALGDKVAATRAEQLRATLQNAPQS